MSVGVCPPKKPKKTYYFHLEWEEEYFFTNISNKNICLICNSQVAVSKKGNIARHFRTLHQNYNDDFPLGSELRKQKVVELKLRLETNQILMPPVAAAVPGNRARGATIASYHISRIIAKRRKPFEDGEIIKEAFLEAADALFEGFSNKADIVTAIKSMQLSGKTVVRRVEMMAADVLVQLKSDLNSCVCFSFQLHEFTDIMDTVQLSIFVRMVFVDCTAREDLLKVIPPKERKSGEDIYYSFKNIIIECGVPIHKLIAITTDGTPDMTDEDFGFVAMCKKDPDFPAFLHYNHCIIHQQMVCGEISNLKNVMDDVVTIVYAILAKAPQNNLFKPLYEEINSSYGEIMSCAKVQWLSKDKVLQKFRDLLIPIGNYFESRNEKYGQLANSIWLLDLAFLTDLTDKLNELILELQGEDLTITDLISVVRAFQQKLKLWISQLQRKDLKHFSNLKGEVETQEGRKGFVYNGKLFASHLSSIETDFEIRFMVFKVIEPIAAFVLCPFLVIDVDGTIESISTVFNMNKTELENEIVLLQNDVHLKNRHLDADFWMLVESHKYPNLKNVALRLKAFFASTYLSQSAFSDITTIKSKYRSRITDAHLDDCIRLTLTKYTPDFNTLADGIQCQPSH